MRTVPSLFCSCRTTQSLTITGHVLCPLETLRCRYRNSARVHQALSPCQEFASWVLRQYVTPIGVKSLPAVPVSFIKERRHTEALDLRNTIDLHCNVRVGARARVLIVNLCLRPLNDMFGDQVLSFSSNTINHSVVHTVDRTT